MIDLTFHDEAVNIWDAGTYYASFSGGFTDYLSARQTMNFPVTVVVQKRLGLTKEEKIEVNSSDFWVNVTEIYHNMKKGQIVDVNPSNYKDGGVLRNEQVPTELDYDRQINVTVGNHIIMSPNILDVLQAEKTGQLNIYLNGRSWTFNSDSTEAMQNDYPRGYYDLRMGVQKTEAITNLVGSDTPQMQLHFNMNRSLFAKGNFTVSPNESIQNALKAGKTPYLFHYNENTNELEFIGAMNKTTNGILFIPMNGGI